MPRRLWIVLLSVWPGLPQIWTGQGVLGFFLAGLFTISANAALVARWVWVEALPAGSSHFFAVLAGMTWVASLVLTLVWVWVGHPERHRGLIERLYREAFESYLQGRWGEVRSRLERLLTLDESDADASFLLASVYLKSDQTTAARRELSRCGELRGGEKWSWEAGVLLSRLNQTGVGVGRKSAGGAEKLRPEPSAAVS